MRTLAITQNMSADGSIEFLGDWFDPTDQAEDLAAEVPRQSDDEDVHAARPSDVHGLPRLLAAPDRRHDRDHGRT